MLTDMFFVGLGLASGIIGAAIPIVAFVFIAVLIVNYFTSEK